MKSLKLSSLGKTWIVDLDGTVVKHNGYKLDGRDSFLDGAKEFLLDIPETDMIVFVTSRTGDLREMTERFLDEHGVRHDHIIFNAPFGERILLNDRKPSGLCTAIAVDLERDEFDGFEILIDENL